MAWFKTTSLDPQPNKNTETWIRNADGTAEQFEVDTYLGKKTDLLALKKNIVENIKEKVSYYQSSRKEIYSPENLEPVDTCPVCGSSSDNTTSEVNIYGAEYVSCHECSHVYVIQRPTGTAIEGFYLNNVTYAATYTDKASAESRLNSIAVPWRDWTIEVFKKKFGRAPKSVLDVGSGAGHFVEACRRAGMKADGIELSESSRKFAKDIWGITLDGRDFTQVAKEYAGYEVVTFWGLLEHTPNPGVILDAGVDVIKGAEHGMIISKLPRWNSLSSAIQRLSTETIIRHLDPMGHIMAFTDSSAAELYHKSGLAPMAAWYYGMDVYETLMQVGNHTGSYDGFTKTGPIQKELQQFVDENTFSDGLTLVGVLK